MVLVIGHLGASVSAPENTLASFALAIEVGADGMECDVRATGDGVPVILHDSSVDRVTDGAGDVAALSLAQVKALRISSGSDGYSDRFSNERIPTLEELLDLVAARKFLALEFKSLAAVAPSVPLLRRRTAAAWCTAWSFDAAVLSELKRLIPELSRSQNIGRVESWEKVVETARELECSGVSVNHGLVDEDGVTAAHGRGLKFYTWTPNTAAEWARLLHCGVDGICTDDPAGLRRHLAL